MIDGPSHRTNFNLVDFFFKMSFEVGYHVEWALVETCKNYLLRKITSFSLLFFHHYSEEKCMML